MTRFSMKLVDLDLDATGAKVTLTPEAIELTKNEMIITHNELAVMLHPCRIARLEYEGHSES